MKEATQKQKQKEERRGNGRDKRRTELRRGRIRKKEEPKRVEIMGIE